MADSYEQQVQQQHSNNPNTNLYNNPQPPPIQQQHHHQLHATGGATGVCITSAAAALHPSGNAPSSSYVNFNQFVLQHNLAQQPALLPLPQQQQQQHQHQHQVVAAPFLVPTLPDAGFGYAAFGAAAFDYFPDVYAMAQQQQPPQQQPAMAAFDMDVLVRNSNLLATANEFVPQNSYAAKAFDDCGAETAALMAQLTQQQQQHKQQDVIVEQQQQSAAIVAAVPEQAAAAESVVVAAAAANAADASAERSTAQTSTSAVSLSPSQGAIRKTYSNGTAGGLNHQHGNGNNSRAGGGSNGGNGGGGNNSQHQRGGAGQQRQNNRNNGWSQQDDRSERSERSSSNWRQHRGAPTNSSNGGLHNGAGNQHQHQQQVGAGSGRTQSQYNEERAYGNNGYDTTTHRADDRSGGRRVRQAANPFARGNQAQQQQQQPHQQQRGGGGQQSSYHQQPRDYQPRPNKHDHFQSSRDHSPRQPPPPHYDSGSAPTTPPKSAAKFDKKKHPEFKPNRNLRVSPTNVAPSTADRITGECSQREKLIREIDAGRLECLVCCENIKPFQSTWSCANCYHIIHLSCIIKWANSSKDDTGWRCPACQHVTKTTPDAYLCFCGKTRNPQYNRNDVAHTCGELCGRTDGCPHPCTLLCHPGPCATCHALVTRHCGCGKTQRTAQCCQKEEVQCAQVCEKRLACGEHRCTLVCHAGACETCAAEVEHRCYCGKDRKRVACVAENNVETQYSCRKLCNRQLACRAHQCKRVCHAGECGDCALRPEAVRTCPCGALAIAPGARKSCSDPVPLCEAVCKKALKCGQPAHPHRCASRCHAGACPQCPKETAVRCRCGHMEQMVKCRVLQTRSDDARCKKRCVKKRNCGKHKCNLECCIDIDHVCPLPCNFTLSCGKHKCDQTCHKGHCQRCYRSSFVELYCECRAQVIYPPVPCGSKRPKCDRPCSRRHGCDHPVTHNCHAAAVCPPCMAFVTVRCFGGHEERKTIPCSVGEFSCGMPCGRALRCGRHKCLRSCHGGECEPPAGEEAAACRQPCQKVRVMCGHKCLAPCHRGECPETACRQLVDVQCKCGNRKGQRSCQEFANEYRRIASAKFATTMEHMQQGGGAMVELSDVLGPIKMSNNKTLDCTDDCKTVERNNRLMLGLQIRNPDTAAKYAPKYSDFAKGWARKDPQLVSMIHDKLSELVKLAKQSQQKSRSHSFPTMNWEKRQLVHEMCQAFGIEAVSYDAEPNRNVVANATRDTSWLPSLSLLEVMNRESGQRRIPVPMNNAWSTKR